MPTKWHIYPVVLSEPEVTTNVEVAGAGPRGGGTQEHLSVDIVWEPCKDQQDKWLLR